MKKRYNWLLIAAGALAVVGSVCYILLDRKDITFSWYAVGFALMGAISTWAVCRFDKEFLLLITSGLYSVAFGFALRVAIPSLSDIWNHVNFIGGNALMGSVFSGIYLVCALLGVIACFQGKAQE